MGIIEGKTLANSNCTTQSPSAINYENILSKFIMCRIILCKIINSSETKIYYVLPTFKFLMGDIIHQLPTIYQLLYEKLYLNNLILTTNSWGHAIVSIFSDRCKGLTIMQQLPSLGKQASPWGFWQQDQKEREGEKVRKQRSERSGG